MQQLSPRRHRPILRQYESIQPATPQRENDLFAIEPSLHRPLAVKFSPRHTLTQNFETYSAQDYDRSAIEVEENVCKLPERGARVYTRDGGLESPTRGRGSGIVFQEDEMPPTFQQSPLRKAPSGINTLFEEDEEDVGEDELPATTRYARPATPLPMSRRNDSDDDDDDCGLGHPGAYLPSLFTGPPGPRSDEVTTPNTEDDEDVRAFAFRRYSMAQQGNSRRAMHNVMLPTGTSDIKGPPAVSSRPAPRLQPPSAVRRLGIPVPSSHAPLSQPGDTPSHDNRPSLSRGRRAPNRPTSRPGRPGNGPSFQNRRIGVSGLPTPNWRLPSPDDTGCLGGF